MAKYAIIRINGRQYKVAENQEVLVDKQNTSDIKPEVLLSVNDDMVVVGKPVLSDLKVKLKVLKQEEKGEKVDVFKYKSKSRYRKHLGFRPKHTRLLIEKIV